MLNGEDLQVEYYCYLTLGYKDFFSVKLDCNEIVMKMLQVDIGDFFEIKGLGKLQVVNKNSNAEIYGGTIYNEIGFTCNRVRSA